MPGLIVPWTVLPPVVGTDFLPGIIEGVRRRKDSHRDRNVRSKMEKGRNRRVAAFRDGCFPSGNVWSSESLSVISIALKPNCVFVAGMVSRERGVANLLDVSEEILTASSTDKEQAKSIVQKPQIQVSAGLSARKNSPSCGRLCPMDSTVSDIIGHGRSSVRFASRRNAGSSATCPCVLSNAPFLPVTQSALISGACFSRTPA
jgi:hypothetical protein